MSPIAFYGFAVAAVCTYAFLPVIAKKMQVDIPPFSFIAITMTVLAACALLAALVFERSFKVAELNSSHIAWLVLFGFVNFIGFAIYLKALTGLPVAHYQVIGAISPIVAGTFAFFFLGEQLTARLFFAVPLVALGLYIALAK